MTKIIVIDDDANSEEYDDLAAAKAGLEGQLNDGDVHAYDLAEFKVIEVGNEYKVTPRVRFELKED